MDKQQIKPVLLNFYRATIIMACQIFCAVGFGFNSSLLN